MAVAANLTILVGCAILDVEQEARTCATPRVCATTKPPSNPKISVFAFFVQNIARERGVTLSRAADMLYGLGVRGFDCDVNDEVLPALAQTALKPINLYYFATFAGADGGAAENARALATARRYGVPRIMTIPPDFTDETGNEEAFLRTLSRLRAFVEQARAQGITVTVEDFGGTKNPCSHAAYIRRMLDAIPDLRLALDSGNLHYAGRGEDILDVLAHAKDRLEHVHLKDLSATENRTFVSLGLGAVPNARIVTTLQATGYDGWYTLENPVGDTYVDTARQIAVLKAWLDVQNN